MIKNLVLKQQHTMGVALMTMRQMHRKFSSTFTKIKACLKASENQAIQDLTFVNGVECKEIKMGDIFHVDNLVVINVSPGAWGDVEKVITCKTTTVS